MLCGDVLRDRHADLRDPYGKEPPFERKRLRVRDGLPQVLRVEAEPARRGLVAYVQRGERVVVKREEVERILHDALLDENVGELSAERLEVERVAAREVLETAA